MSERNLMLVGGGQMGRALVGGMLSQGVIQADQLTVADPDARCQAWWAEQHPAARVGGSLAADCDVVLVAVKPNIVATVAKQPPGFWDEKLIVSIAAGVSLERLQSWFGNGRVVRVMPNTPSLVGAGASAFCQASEVGKEDLSWVEAMLSSVGLAVAVDERQMDAVTGLSGSGPAYICLVIEALADGGVQAGLPRAVAMKLATQTVMGTAELVAKSGQHPGVLKDAVASPGGTTIAAIASLEQNGLRGALIEAVATSARRSAEMGRGSDEAPK